MIETVSLFFWGGDTVISFFYCHWILSERIAQENYVTCIGAQNDFGFTSTYHVLVVMGKVFIHGLVCIWIINYHKQSYASRFLSWFSGTAQRM